MPAFLREPFAAGPAVVPLHLVVRLVVAILAGGAVAWIYRRTRRHGEPAPAFPVTLVLLAGLIAMVTQVIGDNIARAFSLVGALSIVRFRTAVRDTQDTAFVIFAVVAGMAVGAGDLWLAGLGLLVVGGAAFVMTSPFAGAPPVYLLTLRTGRDAEPGAIGAGALARHAGRLEFTGVTLAKSAEAADTHYEATLRDGSTPADLLRDLRASPGVIGVELRRRGHDRD